MTVRRFIVPSVLVLGGLLTTTAFILAFFFTPPVYGPALSNEAGEIIARQPLFSQKIFYFHVPVGMASFLVLFLTAFFGVRFLTTKRKEFDTRARIATEVTLVFITMTMATGILWTRFEWGRWWVWEPRLTTYFIMTLMVIAYFVLRNSVEDEERRAVYASAFGILVFINAPISYAVTRIMPSSIHPVVTQGDGGLTASMWTAWAIGVVGMLMIAFVVYQVRMREELMRDRLEAIKAGFER